MYAFMAVLYFVYASQRGRSTGAFSTVLPVMLSMVELKYGLIAKPFVWIVTSVSILLYKFQSVVLGITGG